ncbi:hypothetical protein TcasGA2_TC012568 [Tribolium castaneum]|uniref:Uncharacterized protein n=1 Tax=Tribolium castaneum TaxID=7070 RepID=D6X390_TRICA|nr:hypothetical protein TcasGA2_TC012568 [Tribolium castaneum]
MDLPDNIDTNKRYPLRKLNKNDIAFMVFRHVFSRDPAVSGSMTR